MMFEALVARVRYHIQKANFMGLKEAESTLLLGESADAIEELSKYVNTIKRLKYEGWYLQQTKFHDGYHAVSNMPLPTPPKGDVKW